MFNTFKSFKEMEKKQKKLSVVLYLVTLSPRRAPVDASDPRDQKRRTISLEREGCRGHYNTLAA